MKIAEATRLLFQSLKNIYDESEASQITDLVMEHLAKMTKQERLIHKENELTDNQNSKFKILHSELLQHKPVQYILHEAWFCGLKFYVDAHVLIPRPETEELVEEIINNLRITNYELRSHLFSVVTRNSYLVNILDIGSGSGCIPIALKKKIPEAMISSIDVCSEALNVAVNNAHTHETEIDFRLLDFLDENKWPELDEYDIIVSNPPYISNAERSAMKKNVLDHEPHLALFVNDDPLIFYKKIAAFGKKHLKKGGSIYAEINENLGKETLTVFKEAGYSTIELKKDMQGKDRIIRANS